MDHVRQHLADDRVAVGAHRIDPKLALAIAAHQLDEAGQALRAMAPDRVELRRGIQAGLIGLQDPQQPVALQVALGADRGVVGDDPRLERRIADRHPPRERQRRRLDRRGHRVVAMDHVVEQLPRAADRVLPEDRVTDEPVRPRRGEQRLELGARARRVEVPPRDRREARVPVPLPAIAPGLGRVYANGTPSRSPTVQLPSSVWRQRCSSGVTRAQLRKPDARGPVERQLRSRHVAHEPKNVRTPDGSGVLKYTSGFEAALRGLP